MILGVTPKVDYAFKYTFGKESTRPILIDVLGHVLRPAPGHAIQAIDLLNPFNPKESLDDKLSILDIKARDQTGRQFNVEMQMLSSPYYDRRILYRATSLGVSFVSGLTSCCNRLRAHSGSASHATL